jgi:hypothetical protein
VCPYEIQNAIAAWLGELREMPKQEDVAQAILEAEEWLESARERES